MRVDKKEDKHFLFPTLTREIVLGKGAVRVTC